MTFNSARVLAQLKALSVLEALQLRNLGFAYRCSRSAMMFAVALQRAEFRCVVYNIGGRFRSFYSNTDLLMSH